MPAHTQVERANTAQQAYTRAGLTTLANRAPGHAATKERMSTANLLYGELTDREHRTWRQYLPTSYRRERYSYDVPPEEVAVAIADASELQLFDRIEIWTPERAGIKDRTRQFYYQVAQRTRRFKQRVAQTVHDMLESVADPMAVGVITLGGINHYYPIVRWGEALHSLSRVRATVWARNLAVFLLTKLPLILLGLIVSGLIIEGFAVTWNAIGVSAVIPWGLASGLGGYLWKRFM